MDAGGLVVSIIPPGEMPDADWPATVVIPCGMGDACLIIGGRAGTISEVCLAWLHKRLLLPLTGCGGWSDGLEQNPPILSWDSISELECRLLGLGLARGAT